MKIVVTDDSKKVHAYLSA